MACMALLCNGSSLKEHFLCEIVPLQNAVIHYNEIICNQDQTAPQSKMRPWSIISYSGKQINVLEHFCMCEDCENFIVNENILLKQT